MLGSGPHRALSPSFTAIYAPASCGEWHLLTGAAAPRLVGEPRGSSSSVGLGCVLLGWDPFSLHKAPGAPPSSLVQTQCSTCTHPSPLWGVLCCALCPFFLFLHAPHLKLEYKSCYRVHLKGKPFNISISQFPCCWVITPVFNCHCRDQRKWECPGLRWALLFLLLWPPDLVRLLLGVPLGVGTQPPPQTMELVTCPLVIRPGLHRLLWPYFWINSLSDKLAKEFFKC